MASEPAKVHLYLPLFKQDTKKPLQLSAASAVRTSPDYHVTQLQRLTPAGDTKRLACRVPHQGSLCCAWWAKGRPAGSEACSMPAAITPPPPSGSKLRSRSWDAWTRRAPGRP